MASRRRKPARMSPRREPAARPPQVAQKEICLRAAVQTANRLWHASKSQGSVSMMPQGVRGGCQ
eukprot:5625540-Pyramimonas_sp.AAC.1